VLFTDRLMLGRYSATTLASMVIAGPLVWSLFSVFGAFSAGTMAVVGRAVGAGRDALARSTVRAVMALALAVGVAVGLGGWWLREDIALAIGGGGADTEAARAAAVIYLGIVLPASPLAMAGQAGMVALQAGGDTRTPMRIGVIGGLLNLAISYVLLFGALGAPEMGIAGAAWGTVAALATHFTLVLTALRRREGPVALRLGGGDLWSPLGPVMRVAGPAFGERVVFHTGYMLFVGLVGRLGEVSMAAHQSLIAIESLGFIAAHGFGVAAAALVAQKLGAARPDEAARCGWIAAGLGVACLSAVSLLFLLIPETLVGLFSEDPAVVAEGARCLRIAALAQPLMALADTFAGALRGAGDTRTPMIAALAGPLAVRLAACWFLAFHLELGLLGIWLGSTLDWAVRTCGLIAVFQRGRWRDIEVIGQPT